MSSRVQVTKVLDPDLLKSDPGATANHRFKYQSFCAAWYATEFLSDKCRYAELSCELDDDIRMTLGDSKQYVLVQVKTQAEHLGPLSLMDDSIKKTVRNFYALEEKDGEQVFRFIIASNVGLAKRPDYHDINRLRDFVTSKEFSAEHPDFTKEIKYVFGKNALEDVSKDTFANCLRKIYGEPDLPKLANFQAKLAEKLLMRYGRQLLGEYVVNLVNDILGLLDRLASKLEENRKIDNPLLAIKRATYCKPSKGAF